MIHDNLSASCSSLSQYVTFASGTQSTRITKKNQQHRNIQRNQTNSTPCGLHMHYDDFSIIKVITQSIEMGFAIKLNLVPSRPISIGELQHGSSEVHMLIRTTSIRIYLRKLMQELISKDCTSSASLEK